MAPIAILSVDSQQRILAFNPGAEAIFGYSAEELLGHSLDKLLPPRYRASHREHVARFGAGEAQSRLMGQRVEIRGLRKNGEEFPAEATISWIPGGAGLYTALLRDVTEQRTAQAALAESEQFSRAILDALPDPVAIVDEHGRIVSVNAGWWRFAAEHGHDLRNVGTGGDYLSISEAARSEDGETGPILKALLRDLLHGHRDAITLEYPTQNASRPRWFAVRAARLEIKSGWRIVLIHHDITSQREARDAIRSIAEGISTLTGEPFFQELVQRLSQELRVDYAFIGELDPNTQSSVRTVAACVRGVLVPKFLYVLGGTPCEHLLTKDCCVYPRQTREHFPADPLLAQMHVEAYLGVPLRGPDGRVAGVLVAMHSQPLEETEIAVSTLRIFASRAAAELERLRSEAALQESEAQLRQIQKMEAIGRLAGGIAHDFNNLLSVINGYSELCLQRTDLPPGLAELLGDIRAAGDRAAILTRQLLSFSRRQVDQPVLVDLNETVLQLERILRRLIGEDIELLIHRDPRPAPVWADAGQLAQVVMNLVVNARDAMPLGGRIEIRISHSEHGPATTPLSSAARGWVRLSVQDNGCGIDAMTQARIFEPFFTTKREGEGTGLGLSIVYGILERAGGAIELESEVGAGTCFHVFLPLGEESVQAIPEQSRADPASGSETVLVVEDEELLRHLIRDVLRSAGYRVLLAENAEAAISLCHRSAEPIHLLVVDVIMPGMSGRDAAEAILGLRPEARVLFISGYTDDEVVRYGVSRQQVPLLPKPFSPAQLTRKIREILDSAPQSGNYFPDRPNKTPP